MTAMTKGIVAFAIASFVSALSSDVNDFFLRNNLKQEKQNIMELVWFFISQAQTSNS